MLGTLKLTAIQHDILGMHIKQLCPLSFVTVITPPCPNFSGSASLAHFKITHVAELEICWLVTFVGYHLLDKNIDKQVMVFYIKYALGFTSGGCQYDRLMSYVALNNVGNGMWDTMVNGRHHWDMEWDLSWLW